MISVFTQVNGSKPTINKFTDEDYNRILDSGGMEISSAVYRHSWATGDWPYEGEDLGTEKKDFLALAKEYKAKA